MRLIAACLAALALPAAAALAQPRDPTEALTELRETLLHARYEDAVRDARALLERGDLSAAQRSHALEALAIAELALGRHDAATRTLSQLYARDPGHRLSDADASPAVQSAFARVREERPSTLPVRLHHESPGTLTNRESPLIVIELTHGADAVEELRLAFRYGGESRFDTALLRRVDGRTAQARIPLLADREEAYAVEYFVEALAPSHTVLGRLGSRREPFRLVIPETSSSAAPLLAVGGAAQGPPVAPPQDEGGSVLGRWWLWTAVAVVLAGGAAAYILLGPPSEGPRAGTFGTATLELR